ncbi:hypothetical protein BD779DRAFT_1767536 [Infundibulicybe gibba]|nr:hypothetical protein BD779DRAFT_1767536 [Infundibulicybe gibba]
MTGNCRGLVCLTHYQIKPGSHERAATLVKDNQFIFPEDPSTDTFDNKKPFQHPAILSTLELAYFHGSKSYLKKFPHRFPTTTVQGEAQAMIPKVMIVSIATMIYHCILHAADGNQSFDPEQMQVTYQRLMKVISWFEANGPGEYKAAMIQIFKTVFHHDDPTSEASDSELAGTYKLFNFLKMDKRSTVIQKKNPNRQGTKKAQRRWGGSVRSTGTVSQLGNTANTATRTRMNHRFQCAPSSPYLNYESDETTGPRMTVPACKANLVVFHHISYLNYESDETIGCGVTVRRRESYLTIFKQKHYTILVSSYYGSNETTELRITSRTHKANSMILPANVQYVNYESEETRGRRTTVHTRKADFMDFSSKHGHISVNFGNSRTGSMLWLSSEAEGNGTGEVAWLWNGEVIRDDGWIAGEVLSRGRSEFELGSESSSESTLAALAGSLPSARASQTDFARYKKHNQSSSMLDI